MHATRECSYDSDSQWWIWKVRYILAIAGCRVVGYSAVVSNPNHARHGRVTRVIRGDRCQVTDLVTNG